MKAWYDDIDAATLQRIKTYSAFNDAKSKNLMMQTMYEYREKEIQDFKETNHELAETCIARKKRIAELEKENAELKEKLYGSRLYAVNEKLNADILLLEKLNKEQKEHIKTLEDRCESIKDTDTMDFGENLDECAKELEEANKAKEWHYVKDELPISDKDRFYFVVDKWNLPMIARFYEEVWSNLTVIDDVIAWKEIVLPELPKESE